MPATPRRHDRSADPGPLLHRYLASLARHPLIDAQQEQALAARYARTGDPLAFQQLVTAHLRLVVKLAREYARRPSQLLDLVQEGNLGLMEAVRRYDAKRGVKLASYAGWWIRAYILRYLMDNARLVRVGRSREDRKRFYQGELPPPEASLEDEGLGAVDDHEPSAAMLPPDVVVERRDTSAFLERRLEAFGRALDERENTVFSERVLAESPAPLRELGDRLQLSGERVRQIEKGLVARFRGLVEDQIAA